MTPDRAHRVAESIRVQLADIVRTEMRDPRVTLLSVTDARLSRDLAVADVYVASLATQDAASREALVAVLNRAAGFLRTAVARRLDLRATPRLRFHYDDLPEQGSKLDALIRQAVRSDEQRTHAGKSDRQAPRELGSATACGLRHGA